MRKSRELEKSIEEIENFEREVKTITKDAASMNEVEEMEPQTKLTKKQIEKYDAPVIKPSKSLFSRESWKPELYGEDRKKGEELVKVIVEHRECPGEVVQFWGKFWPGTPCNFWEIPTNVPVYVWRKVAEHLRNLKYQCLKMNENQVMNADYGYGNTDLEGKKVIKVTKQRIDCRRAESF